LCKFCYLWELQCSHDLCYGPEGCTQHFFSWNAFMPISVLSSVCVVHD
jgi:hypothetical protein